MKMFKPSALFIALLCICISCSKTEKMNGDYEDVLNLPTATTTVSTGTSSVVAANMIASEQNIIPTDINFCNPKTVPICTKSQTVGTLTVKRGANNKIYITYALTGSYYLQACNLFTGLQTAIPLLQREANVCAFPYKKSYNAPYTVKQYTFVLNNQPESFTVAAHAYVVKKQGTSFKKAEDAWADGCSGTQIYFAGGNNHNSTVHTNQAQAGENCSDNGGGGDDEDYGNYNDDCKGGNWATRFTYTGAACALPPPPPQPQQTVLPEPDICSYPAVYFFGIHPIFGTERAWPTPTVNIGGFDYTEAEGRAIAAIIDNSGTSHDSRDAFMSVATLKLSYTGYSLSPTVSPAVSTLETWLSGVGKISATNLPTGNSAVKNAITAIQTFMQAHPCPDRIE